MVNDSTAAKHEVIVAGLGGQGALLFGQLLAQAGMSNHRHVSFFPSYASQMRGAESECTVILSQEEIPCILTYWTGAAIIMSPRFLQSFAQRVRPSGLLIVDGSVVTERSGRADVREHHFPAAKLAKELGESRVANLILLGAYAQLSQAVPVEEIEKVLDEKFGRGDSRLLALNKRALRAGASLGAEATITVR